MAEDSTQPNGIRLMIPMDSLESFLREALPDLRGPLCASQFSGGQSNPTYLLEAAETRLVLRRKPPGRLLPSAHAIEREYRVMKALGDAGHPVPRVLLMCEDSKVIGSPFYLMEWLNGRVLFDTDLPGMTPADRRASYEALIDTLADLHILDVGQAGLSDFGRAGGYLLRQTTRWSEQYRLSATRKIAEMDLLIRWLPAALEAVEDATCLVHGDFRLDNVIWHPDRPEIIGVLDWELSTLGHPLGDLSYFLMTWAFPKDLRYGLGDCDLQGLGIPDANSLAERYAARTGRAVGETLDLLIAYNAFRLAAILQGVYRRGLDGNAADTAALGMGKDVPRLAHVAWTHALRAGA